eukprot:TRINITY_DN2288_c0_g2_i2.p1 TRINITY_DN2288_c0_g2~~TRINITY_DN2288_c0_g2_i2.p1  ORF type:complete len:378 (-),score=103.44 TRINITY_DN2288_c0_g2_i2:482-1615(-)
MNPGRDTKLVLHCKGCKQAVIDVESERLAFEKHNESMIFHIKHYHDMQEISIDEEHVPARISCAKCSRRLGLRVIDFDTFLVYSNSVSFMFPGFPDTEFGIKKLGMLTKSIKTNCVKGKELVLALLSLVKMKNTTLSRLYRRLAIQLSSSSSSSSSSSAGNNLSNSGLIRKSGSSNSITNNNKFGRKKVVPPVTSEDGAGPVLRRRTNTSIRDRSATCSEIPSLSLKKKIEFAFNESGGNSLISGGPSLTNNNNNANIAPPLTNFGDLTNNPSIVERSIYSMRIDDGAPRLPFDEVPAMRSKGPMMPQAQLYAPHTQPSATIPPSMMEKKKIDNRLRAHSSSVISLPSSPRLCVVCFERERQMCYMPCMHLCVCSGE